jgi:hypothetical protein
VLIAPPPTAAETIAVALSSPVVDADQRTTAEGFEITQSYDSLRGVDCRGRLYRQVASISLSAAIATRRRWTITLPAPADPQDSSSTPSVRVRSVDGAAARDALDAGVDILVTDDPAIASYAIQRDEFQTLPLPWDRTYVVLTAVSPARSVDVNLRLTLAQLLADAVRADSRVAARPFWWETTDQCTAEAMAPARASTSRVVYLSGDRVARGLAERLVALAGSRSGPAVSVMDTLLPGLARSGARVTAAALPPSEFAEALRAGDDLAYVVPLRRFVVAPCQERQMLFRAAPWLQSVIALIDTRSSVIVRRGRIGLSAHADASLRILDVGPVKNNKP